MARRTPRPNAQDRSGSSADQETILRAIAHELRGPLTLIVGFSQLLELNGESFGPAKRREVANKLTSNSRRLDQLLQDLLDLDSFGRGGLKVRREPTEIESLVQRVVADAPIEDERQIQVDCEPVCADLDGPKMERIIVNLLVNAHKYSPEEHPIVLRVRAGDDGVGIDVEDRGPGIPAGLRERVFEAGYRTSDASRRASGHGIGLSLVATFAELHGGRAWVTSRRGGGSSFHVTLPAKVRPVKPLAKIRIGSRAAS